MSDTEPTPDELFRQAYAKAIKLLSSREHSKHEITVKLAQRQVSAATIETVLLALIEADYQSDHRFALLLAEQRFARGYGPRAIRAKLEQRGIRGELVGEAIDALAADWQAVASKALDRQFSIEQLTDQAPKQRARIARFLQSRGFHTSDAIKAVSLAVQLASDT